MVLGAETWSCFSVQGIVTRVIFTAPMAQDSQGLPGLRNNLPKYFNVETLIRLFFFRFTIDWIFANFFSVFVQKMKIIKRSKCYVFFEIGFSTIRFFEWKGFDEVIFSESVFHYFELRGSPFEFKCLKLRVKIRGQCYKIRTRLHGLMWSKT